MKISTTAQRATPMRQALPQAKESKMDPFADIFRASSKIGDFCAGALPGVGAMAHTNRLLFDGNSDATGVEAGIALNALGTLSGTVGLTQLAFGGNPGLAFGVTCLLYTSDAADE